MSEGNELLWIAAGLLAWQAWQRYMQSAPGQALQQGGAKLHEIVNPNFHEKDLPHKPLSKTAIVDIARSVGFPNPNFAAAIALAESGGVPNGLGDLRDGVFISKGLWQINTRAWPQYASWDLFDPKTNARVAYLISKGGSDWRHWSTFKTGRYQAYL